jgi:LysR family transcriptional regulator, transcriptional activator of nhaA
MEWLNYHHLLYFWTVVRAGGVAKAARELRVSQPTISTQLRLLEGAMGDRLLERTPTRMVPTELGKTVFQYADEIFATGRALQDAVRGRPTGRPMRLQVGITDAMPKMVARRLLEPALALPDPVRLSCHEDDTDVLLGELALYHLDVVLADEPVPAGTKVKAYSHQLGESGMTWFASPGVAATYRRRFPRSLDGAPVLLPSERVGLRRTLEQWFEKLDVRPIVVADFADSALLKAFGQTGVGLFCAPTVVEQDVARQYGVRVIGRAPEIRERFYALSVERRLKHPAVVAITEQARESIFGAREPRPR